MIDCSKDSVISGSLSDIYENDNCVLTIYNRNNPLRDGDKIQINGKEINVAGALSDGLFADDIIVICSKKLLQS